MFGPEKNISIFILVFDQLRSLENVIILSEQQSKT